MGDMSDFFLSSEDADRHIEDGYVIKVNSDRSRWKVTFPQLFLYDTCPICEKRGKGKVTMVLRKGKYGEFEGCNNYPNCKYTQMKKTDGWG